MAFFWYLCGFRGGTVDYFLYKLIKLAKFAIVLMELSFPAGKVFKLSCTCHTRFPYKVKHRYIEGDM